jgi:hypothetical protein
MGRIIRRPGVRVPHAAVLAVAAALAGCSESTPQAVTAPQFSTAVALVECPESQARSTRGVLGPAGGAVTLDGHSLVLPAGAVAELTEFTITVPASRFVEVRVKADGQDGFEFLEPVTITVSYERCARASWGSRPLQVYKIDPDTRELLRAMGGVDDRLTRRVTALSDSLSGYAIAQ